MTGRARLECNSVESVAPVVRSQVVAASLQAVPHVTTGTNPHPVPGGSQN